MKQRDVEILDRPSYQSLLRGMRQNVRRLNKEGVFVDWRIVRVVFIYNHDVNILCKHENAHLYL